jgi:hypothetical protein
LSINDKQFLVYLGEPSLHHEIVGGLVPHFWFQDEFAAIFLFSF